MELQNNLGTNRLSDKCMWSRISTFVYPVQRFDDFINLHFKFFSNSKTVPVLPSRVIRIPLVYITVPFDTESLSNHVVQAKQSHILPEAQWHRQRQRRTPELIFFVAL